MSTDPLTITQGAGEGAGAPPAPDLGGQPLEPPASLDEVSAEQVAQFEGSTAARLRAKTAELENRTKQFDVPPEDVWNGELVLLAKPCKLRQGQTGLQLIAECTADVLVMDGGALRPVAEVAGSGGLSGWEGVGRLMGVGEAEKVSVGQIITKVCSSDDVVGAWGDKLVGWILGRRSAIERALGE